MSESRLIYECMRELGRHGAVFRTNAGQFYTKSGQRVSGLPRGFSDLLFIRNDGVGCFIECKADKGKLSEEQGRFIDRMRKLGARAGVAYTVDDALRICGIDGA